MRKRAAWSVVSVAVLVGGLAASGVSAAPPSGQRSTYIVVFKDGTNARAEADALRGQGYQIRFTYESIFPGVAVDLPAAAAQGLARNPNVQSVEPDGVVTASVEQSNATWGIDRIDQTNLPLNTKYVNPASGGWGVKAFIVDTGILATHTEFTGRVAPGYTAISDGRGTSDCNGHGTHVSGTVAGTTYGVAKKATLVPVRVLDCNGSGTWSGVVAGLNWVAANKGPGPAVANMSLGGGANSSVDTAVANLVASGVTVAVAAGNSAADACNYSPARTPSAVTVGATTSTDVQASYSNYGTCLDIYAPGSSITSAWNTSTTATNTISGTSMATPHVAGAAARLLGQSPSLSPAQVRDQLVAESTSGVLTGLGTGSPNSLLKVSMPSGPLTITTSSLLSGIQNSSYSMMLMASGGDPDSYTWTATGLPNGLSISGWTISGTPSVSGTFSVSLTVTSGGSSVTTTSPLSLTIAIPAPGSFNKSAPANSSTGVSRTATLSWTASQYATSYEVCWSTSSSGCSTSWTTQKTVTSTSLIQTFSGLTTYYWQVRAVNSTGKTLASNAVWKFKTA